MTSPCLPGNVSFYSRLLVKYGIYCKFGPFYHSNGITYFARNVSSIIMYSGLLPNGLTEDDLSPDDQEEEHHENEVEVNVKTPTVTDVTNDLPTGCLPGVSQEMWQVCCIQYDVSHELLFICALLFLCVIIQLGKTFNCSYPAFPLYVKPILYCIFERDARLKQLLFHLIYVCITFGYLLCCVFKEIQ